MLQLTHQPSPSLRHTLATRLESSLQNMHTPRSAPDPEPLPNMYDPSWAIFNENSMAMRVDRTSGHGTSEIVTDPGNRSSMVIFSAGGGSGAGGFGNGSGNTGNEDDYGAGQWMSNEQYADAWQNTLFRLFGSAEMPMPMDGNELA